MTPDPTDKRPEGRPPPWRFGIGSLILIVVAVAVWLSIARLSLWLGVGLALFAAPALARTVYVASRGRSAGRRLSAAEKAGVFFGWMLASTSLVLAGTVAFFATCFGSAVTMPSTGGPRSLAGLDIVISAGFLAAAFAALAQVTIGVWLIVRRGRDAARPETVRAARVGVAGMGLAFPVAVGVSAVAIVCAGVLTRLLPSNGWASLVLGIAIGVGLLAALIVFLATRGGRRR